MLHTQSSISIRIVGLSHFQDTMNQSSLRLLVANRILSVSGEAIPPRLNIVINLSLRFLEYHIYLASFSKHLTYNINILPSTIVIFIKLVVLCPKNLYCGRYIKRHLLKENLYADE